VKKRWELCRLSDGRWSVRRDGVEVALFLPIERDAAQSVFEPFDPKDSLELEIEDARFTCKLRRLNLFQKSENFGPETISVNIASAVEDILNRIELNDR
jgi:hypothetical protein